jgi:hypothetical protein
MKISSEALKEPTNQPTKDITINKIKLSPTFSKKKDITKSLKQSKLSLNKNSNFLRLMKQTND